MAMTIDDTRSAVNRHRRTNLRGRPNRDDGGPIARDRTIRDGLMRTLPRAGQGCRPRHGPERVKMFDQERDHRRRS